MPEELEFATPESPGTTQSNGFRSTAGSPRFKGLGANLRPDITIGRDMLSSANFDAGGKMVVGPGDTVSDAASIGIEGGGTLVRHADGSSTHLESFNMPMGDEGELHPSYRNDPGGF